MGLTEGYLEGIESFLLNETAVLFT